MAEPNELKLYRYVDVAGDYAEDDVPKGIDYKTGLNRRLHPKRTFSKGELQCVEWYAEFDGTDYTDIIIKVDISYVRDFFGFAISRTTTRTWYNEDGSPNPDTKVTVKYYSDAISRMAEGQKRRGNNIQMLMDNTLKLKLEVQLTDPANPDPAEMNTIINDGRDFMNQYQVEMTSYISEGHDSFYDAITSATEAWLDLNPASLGGATIRQYILGELS